MGLLPVIILICVTSFHVTLVGSHPQCLDSGPPYRAKPLTSFCRFKHDPIIGCCTANDVNTLKILIKKALQQVRNKRRCYPYLKQVLCLQCHSWSAHIYQAESNTNFKKDTALPCLMNWFCKRVERYCKDALQYIWKHQLKAWNITTSNLCSKLYIRDNKDYCYPKIQRTIKKLDQPILYRLNSTIAWQRRNGCLCVKKIYGGLRSPLALVHSNDQTGRLFVLEQVGVIHILYKNGTKLDTPFLNITHKVLTTPAYGDERGLLGIAFHPDYAQNGRVFINYISYRDNEGKNKTLGDQWWLGMSGNTIISEFQVSQNDSNILDANTEKVLMTLEQPLPNHNGGQLLFGADKMLYISLGDGGGAGDPFGTYGNALNMSSLLGKILRIDINHNDSSALYGIPEDNPFISKPGVRPEIYAYGARNMWRCSVDRGSPRGEGKGRIFCGDVGQDKYEEIDIIVKGGNYGWRGREGYKCFDKNLCHKKHRSHLLDNEILPIWAYSHKVGKSVVGGYVYRGCKYPNLRGRYFCADTLTGTIWSLKYSKRTKKWYPTTICMGDGTYCNGPDVSGIYPRNIYSFGEDEEGELYILSTEIQNTGEAKGAVYQLLDPKRRSDPTQCSQN